MNENYQRLHEYDSDLNTTHIDEGLKACDNIPEKQDVEPCRGVFLLNAILGTIQQRERNVTTAQVKTIFVKYGIPADGMDGPPADYFPIVIKGNPKPEIIEGLIQAGGSYKGTESRDSYLDSAIKWQRIEAVNYLATKYPELLTIPNHQGFPPLEAAIKTKNERIVRMIRAAQAKQKKGSG